MKLLGMDLHIHSTLSPCGSSEMTPPEILKRSKQVGLDALVIADHNTAENQEAFLEYGRIHKLPILTGMEVQSKEDVHVLCIFDTLEQVLALQNMVYAKLPGIKNKKDTFGEQVLVDWRGNKIGELDRFLLTGTNISVDDIIRSVGDLGGLALPAHIDRPAFSLWSHLGFIPDYLGLIGVELTSHLPRNRDQLKYIKEKNLGIVMSSDAHWLHQITPPYTWAYVKKFSVAELRLAIQGKEGRYLVYRSDPLGILNNNSK